MRILIDECLPRTLKRHFPGHYCRTVQEMGWFGKENGELLLLAEREFDFLVTTDQGIPHQQNLSGRNIGLLLFYARSNKLKDLLPLLPDALVALSSPNIGRVLRIERAE